MGASMALSGGNCGRLVLRTMPVGGFDGEGGRVREFRRVDLGTTDPFDATEELLVGVLKGVEEEAVGGVGDFGVHTDRHAQTTTGVEVDGWATASALADHEDLGSLAAEVGGSGEVG